MTLQVSNSNKSVSDLKKELLGVEGELTSVEENYSLSALRIFKERYLLKDNAGNICERLNELFERVAVGVGIMDVLYDSEFYDKEGTHIAEDGLIKAYETDLRIDREGYKDFDYGNLLKNDECWAFDKFKVNHFHQLQLKERYVELLKEGKMKFEFKDLLLQLVLDVNNNLISKYANKIQHFYDLMADKYFLPNTPALMNCGTKLGMNAACFTLDMEDDLHDIYQTYADAADIFKSGGGIGVNYSKLRPKGALVKGTGGVSSGTLSWLKIMDLGVVDVVKQGGKRRGAAMGILDMTHPEIEEFIDLKADNKTLTNHNISVNTPNEFFEQFFGIYDDTKPIKWQASNHRKTMDKIAENAWKSGDPGMVFEDNMNSNNLLEDVMGYSIKVTNPCSEISMYPYESCILASINLTKFIDDDNKFQYNKFDKVVQSVTDFLDLMIDATKYPIEKINKRTKECRRIGVGFMGLADALVKMGIKYNSKEGFETIEKISTMMTLAAIQKSSLLARYKGAFPLWYDDKYPKEKLPINTVMHMDHSDKHPWTSNGLRNCSVTTIAPTGTLSMFCDISSGIEPVFSKNFTKNVTVGDFDYNQEEDPNLVTAMEIHPYDHLMAQAVAQKWITNGISKTINLPEDASSKLIEYCYVLSWALGNKGISVYRDNCKSKQVLNNTMKTSIKDVHPISDYTVQIIKELNNIPEKYKQEMLSGLNERELGENKYPGTNRMVIQCEGCREYNTFERTGRSCHMCIKCGHQLGGCS